MKRTPRQMFILLAALLLALLPATGVFARNSPAQGDDLERFFDEYAASALAARRAPGMVVVVVDARGVLLAKGYGLANPETGAPFHPEQTVVSAASVAKAFTALATLQLYERGRFGLDDDVNAHLRAFKVPDFRGRPVTVRQLLTHTDGFEARITADAVRPDEPVPPLREAAQRHMPRRILPPGEQLTYGSYASNLLGVLIEDVSGQPFEEYVEENILSPLGMSRTTFRRPLPEALLRDLAPGCSLVGDDFVVLPFIASRMAPQGGLYTTAADMGRFLQMLLNRGTLGDARVAQPETIDLMLTQQFTNDPRIPGITFGLFEVEHRGQRLLVRDGDGLGTRSRMVLIPSADLGLFVSYNSDDEAIREEVAAVLLEHLFPAPTPVAPVPFERTPPAELEGTYRPLQWDQTTPGKLALLFANLIRVERDPAQPDLLRIQSIGMGEAMGGFEGVSLWREREPLLFEVVQREHPMLGETILFRRDASGRVYLHSGSKYHGVFVRMAWYETPEVQWLWLALCALVLTTTLVWVPGLLRALLRLRRERPDFLAVAARALGLLVGPLFGLLVFQAFGLLFAVGSLAGIPPLAFGIGPDVAFVLNALWIPAVLTVGLVVFAVLAWVRRWWGIAGRVHYTLVALAAVGLVLWLNTWNLLGYRG